MSQPDADACQKCGKALSPGITECRHEELSTSGAVEPESTQTMSPLASVPLKAAPAILTKLESLAPEVERPDALVGRQLGEYAVRRYVGSGGMGIVYEGEHTTIGRKVAIKLIRDEYARGAHARGLLAEARAASSIRHHGIIDIFGFGQQPGVGQYLVMEYLEGRPLDAVLKERAPLTLAEAIPLLCEVLEALSAAHAAGVIHRDLKPSNIFVVRASNGTEYVKVLDFGLAKRTDVPNGTTAQTHSNMIVGTPQYMAPEQALGGVVGPRTDLYSVGVIAFELLTGRRPFSGQSQLEVLLHHVQTLPPAPSSLVPLPNALNELILRLLAKAPQDRPASASEVAYELRAVLASGADGVPPRSSPSSGAGASAPTHLEVLTATLPPPAALTEAATQAPARTSLAPRWYKLGLVATAGILVALGASMAMRQVAVKPVTDGPQPELAEVSPAPAQQVSQPQVTTPTPASEPDASLVLEKSASAPGKKKPRSQVAVEPASGRAASSTPVEPALPPEKKQQPQSTQAATPAVLRPSSESTQPVAERAAPGVLKLTMKGSHWAEVWVDGKSRGKVPPENEHELPAGGHDLELRNPHLPLYQRRIVIAPGDTLKLIIDLAAEGQDSSKGVTP